MQATLLAISLLLGPTARAGASEDADRCLNHYDIACAQEALARIERASPESDAAIRVGLWVAFHQGRYADAMDGVARLVDRGIDVEAQEKAPYRKTAEAADGMEEARGDGVRIRVEGGIDRVLVEEAIDTLQRSRGAFDELFGGGPSGDIVLDICPTAGRFPPARGLPPEGGRATGVVALSKWTRLLLTSPRALSRGYAWKDTIAHEYIHLVVAYRTANRTPVWLQEGLAKHLEGLWRGDHDRQLSAHHRSLLTHALETGEFVPFHKFQRSMAYLDSGDEASLAFAQVSTMVEYLIVQAGLQVLPRLLERIEAQETPEQVVAEEAGHIDFADFRRGWLEWLAADPQFSPKPDDMPLSPLPVVLDGEGDEFSEDPLLAEQPELARFTRLGDLLRAADRHRAALVEYDKAMPQDGPPSPLLLARQADCHQSLKDTSTALKLAERGADLYPEFTLLQVTLGRLYDADGRTQDAVAAWKAAHDLNPYDLEVQRALQAGYAALGDAAAAERHGRYARIVATAGVTSTAPGE